MNIRNRLQIPMTFLVFLALLAMPSVSKADGVMPDPTLRYTLRDGQTGKVAQARSPPSDPEAAVRWCEWEVAKSKISKELDRTMGIQFTEQRLEADSALRRGAVEHIFTKNGYDMKTVAKKALEEKWFCP